MALHAIAPGLKAPLSCAGYAGLEGLRFHVISRAVISLLARSWPMVVASSSPTFPFDLSIPVIRAWTKTMAVLD